MELEDEEEKKKSRSIKDWKKKLDDDVNETN